MFRKLSRYRCSIQYWLHRVWLSLLQSKQRDEAPFLTDTTFQGSAAEEQYLRGLLRQVPWWFEGHRRLAQIAFDSRAEQLLFTSAHAMRVLARSPAEHEEAALCMARRFLRQGNHESAVALLEPFVQRGSRGELQEQLIAALIGVERYRDALALIEATSVEARSAEIQALERYLRSKV